MTSTDPETVTLNGSTEEERAQELTALCEDRLLLACMHAHLENKGSPRDRKKIRAMRIQAIKAFGRNPSEFWDMDDGR